MIVDMNVLEEPKEFKDFGNYLREKYKKLHPQSWKRADCRGNGTQLFRLITALKHIKTPVPTLKSILRSRCGTWGQL